MAKKKKGGKKTLPLSSRREDHASGSYSQHSSTSCKKLKYPSSEMFVCHYVSLKRRGRDEHELRMKNVHIFFHSLFEIMKISYFTITFYYYQLNKYQ